MAARTRLSKPDALQECLQAGLDPALVGAGAILFFQQQHRDPLPLQSEVTLGIDHIRVQ